jgi:ribosomal protein S18 acetylase RimI-like enzyme
MPVDPHDHLPDRLRARPWRRGEDGSADPAEVATMLAVMVAAEKAAIGESDSTADEVEEMFSIPTTDPAASLIVEGDDEAVAFGWIEFDPAASESWIDAYALPDHQEILEALLDYAVAVAQDHRRRTPDAPSWSLRSGAFAADATLTAALEHAGFERVRRFWRMRIDVASTPDDVAVPPLPQGVEILDAHAEPLRRTAYEVQTTSFHDHWDHVTRPYDEWFGFFDHSSLDPNGWWLLTVDGAPAAVCILDDSRADSGDGYVRSLGVLREFRGRGLARLLLQRAFTYYRERGFDGVQLGVDSESPTGANHLYESVGMSPHRVIDAWSRPID